MRSNGKSIVIVLALVIMGINAGVRALFDDSEDLLKEAVSFQTSCPEADIVVFEETKVDATQTNFVIGVCGESQFWSKVGESVSRQRKNPNK